MRKPSEKSSEAREKAIARVNAANEREKDKSVMAAIGWSCVGLVLSGLSFYIFLDKDPNILGGLILGAVALACFFGAYCFATWQPARCGSCGEPTVQLVDRQESFLGIRTKYLQERNSVTGNVEERPYTVTDIEVFEKWSCVSCSAKWSHRYQSTRE